MSNYRLDRSVFAVTRRTTAFHDFLVDNFDWLNERAALGPIPWRELLSRAEIIALDLKRSDGRPVSPQYARKVWLDIKQRMKRRRRKAEAIALKAALSAGAVRPASQPVRSPEVVPAVMNSSAVVSKDGAEAEAEVSSYLARFKHCVYLTKMFANGPRRPLILITHDTEGVTGDIVLPRGIEDCSDLGEEPEIRKIANLDERTLISVEQSRCRSHRLRGVQSAYVWPPHWCLVQQTLPRNRIPGAFLAWKQSKLNDIIDREYVMFD